MKEPRRLLQDDSASPLLRDALRALDSRGPSSEALARLRAGLPSGALGAPGTPGKPGQLAADGGGSVQAGAGAAPGGSAGLGVSGAAGSGLAGLGLGSSHLVLLGLLTSGALAIYGASTFSRATESSPAAGAAVGSVPRAVPAAEPPAPEPEPAHTDGASERSRAASTARDSAAPFAARGSAAASRKRERAAKDRTASSDAALANGAARAEPAERANVEPVESPAAPGLGTDPSPSAAASDSAAGAVRADSSRELAPQPERADAPKAPPAAAARRSLEPQDEAGLLYRAKRLAVRDPGGALRLLDSHAKYFPRGGLAEERDVLTIQLHRRLGHVSDADRLVAEFRVHYPQSMYLRSMSP